MFAPCRPKHQGSTPRETPGNFGPKWPTPCWFERRRIRSQIAAEWSQIAQRSQWRAHRKLPSLFRMVPSLTPYDLPSPKMGVPYAQRYANGHISATGDPIHFMFGSRIGFSRSADRMALSKMAADRHLRKFRMAVSAQRVIWYTSILVLG